MIDQKQVFSSNLHDILVQKAIARTDLSKSTGIPYSTITNWLGRKTYPRTGALKKVADFLGCEPYELTTPHPPLKADGENVDEKANKNLRAFALADKIRKLNTADIDKIEQIVNKMLDVESSIKSAVSHDKINN